MDEVEIEVRYFSKYHIDVLVEGKGTPNEWRFIGFYGKLETNKRHQSWDLLHTLKCQSTLPCFCARDFNEIL